MVVVGSEAHQQLLPPRFTEDALERAAEIAHRLRGRWEETELLRRVPDVTMNDLRAAGLLRINQPARFGGIELGIEAVFDLGATLAEGDVSVAWAYVILVSHEWIIGLFPSEAQDDVWGVDPTALMSSSFSAAKVTVSRVDDGWRLRDGVWPFSTGSDHAQWAMLGFRLPPDVDGGPSPVRWGLVPRQDYVVDTDWRTIGARGTGSNSLLVDDVVVPDHRLLDPLLALAGRAPGADVNPSPLFRQPFSSLALYLAAPILGGARAAVKDFGSYMESKRLIYTGERVGTEGAMLTHLGEVSARVSVAETVLRAAARAADDSAIQRDASAALASIRDCTFAVRMCADAVDETMRRSGGSAIYEGHPANKWWRDVRSLAAHQGFNTDTAYGNWGRLLMGLPPMAGPFG